MFGVSRGYASAAGRSGRNLPPAAQRMLDEKTGCTTTTTTDQASCPCEPRESSVGVQASCKDKLRVAGESRLGCDMGQVAASSS